MLVLYLVTYLLQKIHEYNYFASAHLVLVVPEYVGGRLRGELDEAGEVDGGAHVHVQVRPAQDTS